MKSVTVILFGCLAVFASGSYMTKEYKYADKDFLAKQKFIFDIFQHIYQDDVFASKYEKDSQIEVEDYRDKYDSTKPAEKFYHYYQQGYLPEYEIFSITDQHHIEYASYLYDVFYYAKDWDTFYKAALWARFNVNKGAFIYAFSTAVVHREDFKGFILPPIYEVFPYYFFNTETIQKAQFYKMHGFHGFKKVEDVYTAVIQSNYTGVYGHVNEDNLLAYFLEDVGLNSFYYYYNLDYPYWLKSTEDLPLKNDRRGEFYFYIHQQLLARYYMERLSNDLDDVPEFSAYGETETGYYSGLRYYNGVHFPDRGNYYNFFFTYDFYNMDLIEAYDHRFMDAIDFGYVHLRDNKYFAIHDDPQVGVEALGNLVQGNKDSLNDAYGNFEYTLRRYINLNVQDGKFEKPVPGVLDHYETTLRDPIFFEVVKRFLRYYYYYTDRFDPYSKKDLYFDGVKIESAEVDKLVTYYDKFDADITNAVDVEPYDEKTATEFQKFGRLAAYEGNDFVIKARQYRLNHLPFNVKLTVQSKKAQKAVVKVFYGPKYDKYGHKIQLNDNRKNFVELDHFVVDLTEGKNAITRSSDDFSWYVKDSTSYYELYKEIFLATNSAEHKFKLDMSEAHCGFPARLMLPKGKKGGMPFQFYFIVRPYEEPKVKQFTGFDSSVSCGVGSGARYLDNTPFGYPFDRQIYFKDFFYDNMYFYDTYIYHKTEADVNAVQH